MTDLSAAEMARIALNIQRCGDMPVPISSRLLCGLIYDAGATDFARRIADVGDFTPVRTVDAWALEALHQLATARSAPPIRAADIARDMAAQAAARAQGPDDVTAEHQSPVNQAKPTVDFVSTDPED